MTQLHSEAMRKDPRLAKAKQQFLTVLQEYKAKICAIQPPRSTLALDYEALLEEARQLRANPLYYPYIGSGLGNGPFVELLDGSVKIDFANGIGVHPGHSIPEIVEAALDAALDDTVQQGNLMQNGEAFLLMQRLTQLSKFPHCFLTTSGAMANENAFKMAFQKKAPATRILCFNNNFAGRSLALTAVTDRPAFRVGLPSLLNADYVPFFDTARPKESTDRAVRCLHEHLQRYPGEHALMIIELIQGEGGVLVGERDYYLRLAEVLKNHDIPLLADEVQTFGRTSCPFAFQHFGLEGVFDFVTIGKLAQVCATLFTREMAPKSDLLAQTFISSSASLRASLAVLETLQRHRCFGPDGKNVWVHEAFVSRFENLRTAYPHLVAGPYGVGSMVAFTPFDGRREKVIALAKRLFDKGVIGFVAGGMPTRLRFLVPAIAVDEPIIDMAFSVLKETLLEMA